MGITFGKWLELLGENRYAVDRRYWGRALAVTALSLRNSYWHGVEMRRFGAEVEQAQVQPPLFILGHWRNGTTLLHELLIMDQQFAYANVFEVANPHLFLSLGDRVARALKDEPAQKRPMDNMQIKFDSPGEDEAAMAVVSLRSPAIGWVFPRREAFYDRYYTFRGVPLAEVREWQAACLWFYRKLSWKYRRPLVLKSPPHTGRVRALLELFPEARFVHIARDPYLVFRSTQNLYAKAVPSSYLQAPDLAQMDAGILRRYAAMYDAYLEDRALIPAGRLCDIRFEDLERDAVGQVGLIYEHLGLPGFAALRPRLEAYAAAKVNYQKNVHPPLDPALRERVAEAWGRYFAAWGYPV